MKYTVLWKPDAESDLTSIWANAPSEKRAEITAAANLIDRRLQRDPENDGESRAENLRVVIELPLVFTIDVNQEDRLFGL